jgi:hypothetical protein
MLVKKGRGGNWILTSSSVKNPNDTDATCAVVISLVCRDDCIVY